MTMAILLVLVTMVGASVVTGASLLQVVQAWRDGCWTLAPFILLMVLAVISGIPVVSAPPLDRLIAGVAAPSVDDRQPVCAADVGMGATWHAGLPASALPMTADRVDFRDILGYPFLVVVAYTFVVSVPGWLLPGLMSVDERPLMIHRCR